MPVGDEAGRGSGKSGRSGKGRGKLFANIVRQLDSTIRKRSREGPSQDEGRALGHVHPDVATAEDRKDLQQKEEELKQRLMRSTLVRPPGPPTVQLTPASSSSSSTATAGGSGGRLVSARDAPPGNFATAAGSGVASSARDGPPGSFSAAAAADRMQAPPGVFRSGAPGAATASPAIRGACGLQAGTRPAKSPSSSPRLVRSVDASGSGAVRPPAVVGTPGCPPPRPRPPPPSLGGAVSTGTASRGAGDTGAHRSGAGSLASSSNEQPPPSKKRPVPQLRPRPSKQQQQPQQQQQQQQCLQQHIAKARPDGHMVQRIAKAKPDSPAVQELSHQVDSDAKPRVLSRTAHSDPKAPALTRTVGDTKVQSLDLTVDDETMESPSPSTANAETRPKVVTPQMVPDTKTPVLIDAVSDKIIPPLKRKVEEDVKVEVLPRAVEAETKPRALTSKVGSEPTAVQVPRGTVAHLLKRKAEVESKVEVSPRAVDDERNPKMMRRSPGSSPKTPGLARIADAMKVPALDLTMDDEKTVGAQPSSAHAGKKPEMPTPKLDVETKPPVLTPQVHVQTEASDTKPPELPRTATDSKAPALERKVEEEKVVDVQPRAVEAAAKANVPATMVVCSTQEPVLKRTVDAKEAPTPSVTQGEAKVDVLPVSVEAETEPNVLPPIMKPPELPCTAAESKAPAPQHDVEQERMMDAQPRSTDSEAKSTVPATTVVCSTQEPVWKRTADAKEAPMSNVTEGEAKGDALPGPVEAETQPKLLLPLADSDMKLPEPPRTAPDSKAPALKRKVEEEKVVDAQPRTVEAGAKSDVPATTVVCSTQEPVLKRTADAKEVLTSDSTAAKAKVDALLVSVEAETEPKVLPPAADSIMKLPEPLRTAADSEAPALERKAEEEKVVDVQPRAVKAAAKANVPATMVVCSTHEPVLKRTEGVAEGDAKVDALPVSVEAETEPKVLPPAAYFEMKPPWSRDAQPRELEAEAKSDVPAATLDFKSISIAEDGIEAWDAEFARLKDWADLHFPSRERITIEYSDERLAELQEWLDARRRGMPFDLSLPS